MKQRVGILGGGQLGRMLALAAHPLGVRTRCLDRSADAPAGAVTELVVGDYDDARALAALAECDVVTFEWESISEHVARKLAARAVVRPSPDALAVAQDRLLEKTCFGELSIPTPRFAAASNAEELARALGEIGTPAVVKTRRLGYDGKGQCVVRETRDPEALFHELGSAPLIVEAFVEFERELSILAVRGAGGETAFYPLVENHHHEGMLDTSYAPAPRLTPALQALAERHARRLLERFDYVGVLALELFEHRGELVANEIAPRVHNSGHSATGRSKAPRPASSRITCARSSVCRSARPRRSGCARCRTSSARCPTPRACSRSLARTCTTTASTRARAARSGTSRSGPPTPRRSPSA
jgi:5-(carboxyamino)imidazole ribonucleotide synthase